MLSIQSGITVSSGGLLELPADIKVNSYFSSGHFFYVKETDVMKLVTSIQQSKKSQTKIENWSAEDIRKRFEKIRNVITTHRHEIAGVEALYQGTTRDFQKRWNVQPLIELIDSLCAQLESFDRSSPKGLIGAITPKFQSFYEIGWRVLYSLFHKNGLIIKPATETALSASLWQEIINECDLPEGLISFVYGPGHRVGKFLIEHPGVKHISFSGAYETIKAYPLSLEKRYQLFFNGKNSVCLLPDFDFKNHIQEIARVFIELNGRSSFSPARLFLLDSMEKEFKESLIGYLKGVPKLTSIDDEIGFLPLKPSEMDRLNQLKSEFQNEEAKIIFDSENFCFYSDLANCSELHQVNLELPIYNLTAVKYTYEMSKWINNNSFGHSVIIFGPNEKAQKLVMKSEVGVAVFNPNPLKFQAILPVKMSGFGDLSMNIPNSFYSSQVVVS